MGGSIAGEVPTSGSGCDGFSPCPANPQVLSPLSDSILAEKTVTVLEDKVSVLHLAIQLVAGLAVTLHPHAEPSKAFTAVATAEELLRTPKQVGPGGGRGHVPDGDGSAAAGGHGGQVLSTDPLGSLPAGAPRPGAALPGGARDTLPPSSLPSAAAEGAPDTRGQILSFSGRNGGTRGLGDCPGVPLSAGLSASDPEVARAGPGGESDLGWPASRLPSLRPRGPGVGESSQD